MELLLLLMLLFLVPIVVSASIARRLSRRRRVLEEERRRHLEAARRGSGGGTDAAGAAGMSPFGMFPLGGIFEQLLTGPGTWSRSYVFDEASGHWVDISEVQPEPAGEERAPTTEKPRRARTTRERKRGACRVRAAARRGLAPAPAPRRRIR